MRTPGPGPARPVPVPVCTTSGAGGRSRTRRAHSFLEARGWLRGSEPRVASPRGGRVEPAPARVRAAGRIPAARPGLLAAAARLCRGRDGGALLRRRDQTRLAEAGGRLRHAGHVLAVIPPAQAGTSRAFART